ncbi:MAG: SGNH/GDSL hydrolase family protein [Leptolyngbyaceae cyanobacterium SL_1_1]|nr:SGNH/GDSL hydrolase family protein [Leptolyngbyaceae cyanobacterium RM1_1_2]NJO10985.1 SGNH/GDSL hydrolase family protein [Leptolyngbyaceae cyanobacterium SL_1_1]
MLLRKTLITAGILSPLLVPLAASAATFSQLFVFGDSLSDTGNLYAQTSALIPFLPVGIPASPPYAQKFSNDDLWVEYLADELLPGPGAIAVNNFAVGGATTSNFNIINNFNAVLPFPVVPDFDGIQDQVFDSYLGLSPVIDPDALYTLWGGANDYLGGGVTDPTIPVNNLETAITAFVDAGVKNLLVLNLPDLGQLPVASSDPVQAAALTAIANQHNTLLAQAVQGISQVKLFDVKTLFDQALAGGFGFTNTTAPCLQGFVAPLTGLAGVPCSNPDGFLFWDDVHPTTRAHEEIAKAVLVELHQDKPVVSTPEPVSGLSLLALGSLSALGLKRRQTAENAHSSRKSATI